MIEDTLESVHYVAGQAQGEIALGLASKRGVTRARLLEWAAMYHQASEDLLALYNSLPVPKETNDEQ